MRLNAFGIRSRHESFLHGEGVGINDDNQSRLGVGAAEAIGFDVNTKLFADPLLAASLSCWI